jgi:eukaryotic-like serine/threonine-protein kinase
MTIGWIRRLQPVLVCLGIILLLGHAAGQAARGQGGKLKKQLDQQQQVPRFDPNKTAPTPTSTPEAESDNTWLIITVIVVLLVLGAGIGGWLMLQQQLEKKSKKNKSSAPVGDKGVIEGYRLQNLMQTGQTSQVWEVVEVASMRHFAMKLLLPEKAKISEHRRFLFHEAEVGIQLAHPNIIKIIKVIREENNPCFIMEFFPAGSLKIRIMRKQDEFLREHAQDILKQAATAFAFMNAKGWVHRDVKPDNILVNSAGEVRVIDFAIAHRIEKPSLVGKLLRRKGKSQGTRSYMSPEQIRGEPLDGRADIYSFGATAYELVTSRPPFRGSSNQDLLNKHILEKPMSPQIHNPDITNEFAELVLRMLAKKREHRPRDFHEVMMALRTMKVYKSQGGKSNIA